MERETADLNRSVGRVEGELNGSRPLARYKTLNYLVSRWAHRLGAEAGYGEVLFSDPTTRRLCVEVARITARHRLFARATNHLRRRPDELWGRRTLFDYGGERILVNELFLPGIPALST